MILFPGSWRQKVASNDRVCSLHTYLEVLCYLERTFVPFGKVLETHPNDPCIESQETRTVIRDNEASSLL